MSNYHIGITIHRYGGLNGERSLLPLVFHSTSMECVLRHFTVQISNKYYFRVINIYLLLDLLRSFAVSDSDVQESIVSV